MADLPVILPSTGRQMLTSYGGTEDCTQLRTASLPQSKDLSPRMPDHGSEMVAEYAGGG